MKLSTVSFLVNISGDFLISKFANAAYEIECLAFLAAMAITW